MKHIAVLFSGTGTNMASLISRSVDDDLDVRFIAITDNPHAEGIAKAEAFNVPVYIIPGMDKGWKMSRSNDDYLLDLLRGNSIDYVVLAGYMRIMNPSVIEHYSNRIVNIHPALLPLFRGRDAQKQAYEYGVKMSGCTVHFVDRGVDTGPIIAQRAVDISHCSNAEEVKNAILPHEHELYYEVLKQLVTKGYRIEDRHVIPID